MYLPINPNQKERERGRVREREGRKEEEGKKNLKGNKGTIDFLEQGH